MNKFFALCSAIALSVISCTNFLGTGSTTETALVSGMLYEPDGTTPANGATVYIRRSSSRADVSGSAASAVDSTQTDNLGKFSFDSALQAGIYIIEAVKNNNAAVIDPVNVTSVPLTLSPDTLKPAGAISGTVDLAGGWESGKVYALVSGVNRFAQVAQDGSFTLLMLAEGIYDLRILATIDGYDIFDTSSIEVVSAITTELDTIHLPYNGIPVPNVTITQDSVKKLVTVAWCGDASSKVKSYNVYRIEIGPDSLSVYLNAPFAGNRKTWESSTEAFWQLNTTPVTDTFFVDSTTLSFHKYLYRVTALDSNANEGKAATSEIIEIASAFKLVKTIIPGIVHNNLHIEQSSIALLNNEFILAYYSKENVVTRYTLDGTPISNWNPSQLSGGKICGVDGQGYSYFQTNFNWSGSIQKYDPMGNYIYSIDTADILVDSNTWFITGSCVDEVGNIYCSCKYQIEGTDGIIVHFSSDGVFQKFWDLSHRSIGTTITVKNGTLYCVDRAAALSETSINNEFVLCQYDTSGSLKNTTTFDISVECRNVRMGGMDLDKDGNIYLFDFSNNSIRILNQQMQLIGRFNSPFPVDHASMQIAGCTVTSDGSIILSEILGPSILIFKRQ